MKKYTLPLTLSLLFFSGCYQYSTNSKVIKKTYSEPEWLLNPEKYSHGKITAVGCAKRHYKGVAAQKKLALQRAIDEIATQVQTKVSNVTYRQKTVSASNYASRAQSSSLQETANVSVGTKVMEYYKKPDGDICVWVVKR